MFRLKNFLMVALLIFAVSIGGIAEAGIVTDKMPLQCYVDHKVISYDTGTGKAVGWIDANVDLVQITGINGSNGVAIGTHPSGNRRVERLFWARDVFADTNYANRDVHVSGSHKVYTTKDSGSTMGSISNEDVTVVADNGNRAQIIYRLNNGQGYKMGWIPSSVVRASRQDVANNNNGNINVSNSGSFDPIWPLANSHTITTLYRYSSGNRHSTRYRYGIDMSAPEGEEVLATEAGTVIASQYSTSSGFGNMIKIKHDNGKVSLYAHMSARLVENGQRVSKGQIIGRVGHTSAKYKIGNHLHFELGNSDDSGAGGDPWQEYFKPKYGSIVTLTQAAAKYPNP